MNSLLIFLTFVMVLVILILVLVLGSIGKDGLASVRAEIRDQNLSPESPVGQMDETSEFPAVQTEPTAIPLDPDNEPKWMTYRGKSGVRRCTCHNLDIQTGQRVCLWPREDVAPGAMDIYCESWMKEQEERR